MELGTTVLTKITSTGVTLSLVLSQTTESFAGVEIVMDGTVRGTGDRVYRIIPTKGVRHAIGYKPMVGLSDEEAVIVQAAIDATSTTLRAAHNLTPDGKRAALHTERDMLRTRIAALYDEQSATFERLHATQDMTAWSREAAFEGQITAAEAALGAFDAAHPEIVAEVKIAREIQSAENVRAAAWS